MRVIIRVYMTLIGKLGWSTKEYTFDRDEIKFLKLVESDPSLYNAIKKYEGDRWRPIILVNGRHIEFLGGFEAVLKDGDSISIFPPLAGG
ncbi:molybdopterin synthase sulfur carrier subunit [Candidatus Geothermarchaeota archaeon]|nr:MAG: molybdopterin synthase sulfur carrier subunit [Candidatus Geothermarchaeota archaeon]